jgi:hypothetical protein
VTGRQLTDQTPEEDGDVSPPFLAVDRFRALYAAAGPDLNEVPAATHWPSVPAIDCEAEWAELRTWVEHLLERFAQLDHHVVPACWWRHNEHVEALSALRDHELVSYSGTAPATGPIDWLRALRDVTVLLKTWTAELSCGATHQPPPTRLQPAGDSGWGPFVASDTERRRQAAIQAAV